MMKPCKSVEMVLCQRCETLEKTGIKRRDPFYKYGEYCKQCRNDKKQNILNDGLLKTLKEIGDKYGKSN